MPVREATAVQTLMISEAAVLALLAIEGERSPYDLMKCVSGAIGYIWAPAKTQLYAILPRLERDGLRGHLEWFRETTGAQLEQFRALEQVNSRTGHNRFHWFLLRLGLEHAEHLLEWTDWVERELEAEAT